MKAVHDFLITPKGDRYNNIKKIGDKQLITNTDMSDHKHVNREAIVKSVPSVNKTDIKVGDEIIIHHNVFRRWYNMHCEERNSRGYFDEKHYLAQLDQVYLYKKDDEWKALDGWCFVQPLKSIDQWSNDSERPLMGIVKYTDGSFNKGDLIGFIPKIEHEFIINDKRLYKIMTKFITIKYEYQGDEEEYNPSWAKSG